MKPDSARTILLKECTTFNKNGFDTDIDLYVSLVRDKKYRDAARVYEKKLIPRYPDEYARIRIIRYYRKNDSRFAEIYADAVRELLERIVSAVKKLVSHLCLLFEGENRNPIELLKKIEIALRVIPRGRDEGIAFLEKMETYTILLDYMTEEFSTASDILKRYFDNTLFVKVEIKNEKEIPAGKDPEAEPEGRRDSGEQRKKITIDLDKIEFTEEELSLICIDSRIRHRSYQVLAYCRLYWKHIFNQDFEKKIFLYSKKFSTIHYRIFQIIKSCRVRHIGDDVILLEIYSLLSNRYQYSLKEDMMMQALWRKIKPADISQQRGKKSDPGNENSAFRYLPEKGKNGKTDKIASGKKELRKIEPHKHARRLDTVIMSLKEKLDLLCSGDSFNAHEEFSAIIPKYIERYLIRHRKKDSDKDPYNLKGALYVINNYISDNYSE
ncbi:MAG: hypothetical protein RBT69_10395, partial [Spirochaetia bacterium]|nr:hypothetical protein [Spirochaetia bacterium]